MQLWQGLSMSNHFDKAKWQQMTIFEQMGNIGSEVGRAVSALKSSDENRLNGALLRGLDLLDATAEFWAKTKPGRCREILRSREQFVQMASNKQPDISLDNYFFQFALAARKDR